VRTGRVGITVRDAQVVEVALDHRQSQQWLHRHAARGPAPAAFDAATERGDVGIQFGAGRLQLQQGKRGRTPIRCLVFEASLSAEQPVTAPPCAQASE